MRTPFRLLAPVYALILACSTDVAPPGDPDADAPEAVDDGVPFEAGDADGDGDGDADGDADADGDGDGDADDGFAADGDAPPLHATGTAALASVAAGTCGPATTVPTSRCFVATVTGCDGVGDLTATLKVSDPSGAAVGTVVLGSGGDGRGMWEQFGADASRRLNDLVAAGYRVVQRAWQPDGWCWGPSGPARAACHYATLLAAIHTGIHEGGAYCATGNSGGSAEIAYALAHYGMERLLDLAVVTSGPPMGRLDYGCLGAGIPAWPPECAGLGSCGGTPQCSFGEFGYTFIDRCYGGVTACRDRDPAWEPTWREDSVWSVPADLDYGVTDLRGLYGGTDCSESVTLGRAWLHAVTSAWTDTVVPGTPHALPSTSAGADAVYAAMIDGCVPHH